MAGQETEKIPVKEEPEANKTPTNNHGGAGPNRRGGGGPLRGFRGGRGASRFQNHQENNNENNSFGGGPPRKRPFRGNVQGGPGPRNTGDHDGGMQQHQHRQGNQQGMGMGMQGPRNADDRFHEKLQSIGGPTYDLPPFDTTEKKFSGRGRLYIGNVPPEMTDDEINELFKPYGETNEVFINKEKNFGFIRMDYRASAEKAKRELDGINRHGRTLKIRFAPNGSSIKVKNLTPFISNELLHTAFQVFGEIERCVIIVDDRGKSTGEGLVDFMRKNSAQNAIRRCTEGCFFLTSQLRPVIVEPYEALDDLDGMPDKVLPRKNPEFQKSREVGPRFAAPNSFEHEYGMRWKQLHDLFHQKEDALKKELDMESEKLEAQMEFARYEHETELLREQLRSREMDRDRQKREWEMKERQVEEQRVRSEEQMRRQQEEMQTRVEEMRRRQQENNLFVQAHTLNNILNQEEQDINYQQTRSPYGGGEMELQEQLPMEPKAFMNSYDRRYEGRDMGSRSGGGNARGHWNERSSRDEFQNKRRRY